MKIKVASPSDNPQLLEFYKSFPVKGVLDLKVDRRGDFFGPYRTESNQYQTYILKDDDDSVQGLASFIIKEVMLNEKPTVIAYGRDLRVSHHRKAILEWGKHFVPCLEEVSNNFGVEYFFSILNMMETKALNAFVHPRNLKRLLPRYYGYRRFNLVTIHGRFPWASNPLPHMQIRHGSSTNADALIYYLCKKNSQKNLATYWDSYGFFKQLQRWRGLKIEDFLIAFDSQNNIVGCCAPWSSDGIQEFIPLEYSLKAHNFRQFLKFGRLLGWTRPLTKPSYRLQLEENLQFQYLTHLFADNEDIFEALLWAAFNRARSKDFLVYCQGRNELVYKRPLNWVSSKLPHGLYCMVPPDREAPEFLNPSNEAPVSLEGFFV
ncbi:MAG: hypothetical protein IPM97_07320 [Bdellovibrionaceae bacterium]|nr:hypothetical protein [Pseudobdellovibrionaceae bacterium]